MPDDKCVSIDAGLSAKRITVGALEVRKINTGRYDFNSRLDAFGCEHGGNALTRRNDRVAQIAVSSCQVDRKSLQQR